MVRYYGCLAVMVLVIMLAIGKPVDFLSFLAGLLVGWLGGLLDSKDMGRWF